MSKRGDLRAELRKARQELEQLKDPLIQKARAMGYAAEYIEQLEAENKRLKQELADQAISDIGGTVEVIANLEKENKEKDEILRIFKWLFSEESLKYQGCTFGVEVDGVKLYFKTKDDYKTIMEWLEENR